MAEGTDGGGGVSPEIQLAETFAEIARALLSEPTLGGTLSRISSLAVETIDGCDHAGISLVRGRNITTEGASDDVPERVDAIQYEVNDGPCVRAIRDHEVLQSDDLSREDRWPEFARRAAAETGVQSMLSFRLFAEENTMGALNLYSRETDAFNDDAIHIGAVFATHAAVAMVHARERDRSQAAIESRDLIGQAKGILMARSNISEEQAFDMLVRASQRMNVKLRDVAKGVAHPPQEPL